MESQGPSAVEQVPFQRRMPHTIASPGKGKRLRLEGRLSARTFRGRNGDPAANPPDPESPGRARPPARARRGPRRWPPESPAGAALPQRRDRLKGLRQAAAARGLFWGWPDPDRGPGPGCPYLVEEQYLTGDRNSPGRRGRGGDRRGNRKKMKKCGEKRLTQTGLGVISKNRPETSGVGDRKGRSQVDCDRLFCPLILVIFIKIG